MKITTLRIIKPSKIWKLLSLPFFLLSLNLFLNTTLLAQQEAVEKVLNSDGTLKKGINGSFSTKGYNLT